VCVYPVNRSLDWYLLPDYERRGMRAEHGSQGRKYEDVRGNTALGLGHLAGHAAHCVEAARGGGQVWP
jgi:chlorite dismutase